MKKKILLTFDYEIFFGVNSGTPDKCLLEPTAKLLTIFRKHNIKGTFFVDVLYYIKLLENDATACDALKIKDQLKAIVAQGSRIELHLHPHWIDAVLFENKFHFSSYDHYRLDQLKTDKIQALFQEGKKVLEDIASEVVSGYKVSAFRAGGFCVQPFSNIKKSFLDANITIDSSIAPEYFINSKHHRLDFRGAPKLSLYQFTDDPLKVEHDGLFYEIPITTYRRDIRSKVMCKLMTFFYRKEFEPLGDGSGMPVITSGNNKYSLLSLEGSMYPDEILRQINKIKSPFITVIAHPKSLSNISFKNIECLISHSHNFLLFDDLIKLQRA
jgi:hypothetical protein